MERMSPAQSVKGYLLRISNDHNALLQFVTELHRDFAGTLTSRWTLTDWQLERLTKAPMGPITPLLNSVCQLLNGQYAYLQPGTFALAGEDQSDTPAVPIRSMWLGSPLELQLLTRAVARMLMPVLDETIPFGSVQERSVVENVVESEFLSFNRNEVRSVGVVDYSVEDFTLPVSRGKRLAGKFLYPISDGPQRTIVLLPPMKGLWTDYALLLGILLRNGFTVAVFDGHGHGENVGLVAPAFRQYLDDFKSVASYVRECSQCDIGIVGCSLGGIMSLILASTVPGLTAVVAEGVSISRGVGVTNLIKAEHPLVSNYYGEILSSAGRMLVGLQFSDEIKAMLAWGERDPVVHLEDQRKTIEFFQSRIHHMAVRHVAGGAHFLPFGFPMQQPVVEEYLQSISQFFTSALSGIEKR
jgi:hypothetical protein